MKLWHKFGDFMQEWYTNNLPWSDAQYIESYFINTKGMKGGSMEIEVIKVIKLKITHCYHQCPHFGVDGGPSGPMMCNHPEIEKKYEETRDIGVFYIISHPECDEGFPKKCPLLAHAKGKRV